MLLLLLTPCEAVPALVFAVEIDLASLRMNLRSGKRLQHCTRATMAIYRYAKSIPTIVSSHKEYNSNYKARCWWKTLWNNWQLYLKSRQVIFPHPRLLNKCEEGKKEKQANSYCAPEFVKFFVHGLNSFLPVFDLLVMSQLLIDRSSGFKFCSFLSSLRAPRFKSTDRLSAWWSFDQGGICLAWLHAQKVKT